MNSYRSFTPIVTQVADLFLELLVGDHGTLAFLRNRHQGPAPFVFEGHIAPLRRQRPGSYRLKARSTSQSPTTPNYMILVLNIPKQ